jgi:hypothetical protein
VAQHRRSQSDDRLFHGHFRDQPHEDEVPFLNGVESAPPGWRQMHRQEGRQRKVSVDYAFGWTVITPPIRRSGARLGIDESQMEYRSRQSARCSGLQIEGQIWVDQFHFEHQGVARGPGEYIDTAISGPLRQ